MRFFEMMLVLSSLVYILIVKYNTKKAAKYTAAAFNIIFLLLHIMFEGVRWQMAFSYIIACSIVIITFIKAFKRNPSYQISKVPRRLFKRFIVLLLMLTTALCYFLPVFKLPRPTGEFSVGVTRFHWIDTSRRDPFSQNKAVKRDLMVKIFYPADKLPHTAVENYFTDWGELTPLFSKYMGLPSFGLNHLSLVKTNSSANIPLSLKYKSYPLILFSHGLGLSKELYTSILEELASRGYIVAAVDHTDFTFGTVFADKHVVTYKLGGQYADNRTLMGYSSLWAGDLRFVLDKFQELASGKESSIFNGKINMKKVGAFGHSFGGSAVYNLCFTDSRIKCGVDLDGSTFYIPKNNPVMKTPFMMITNPTSASFVMGSSKPKLFKNLDAKTRAMYKKLNISESSYNKDSMLSQKLNESLKTSLIKGGTLISIIGARHNSFTDYGFIFPLESTLNRGGIISPKKANEIINTCLLAFFDKYLNGKDSIILNRKISPFKEMIFN